MQKTDLNVSPYYDDFDPTDNFHRVLFRPGFAVQARELTTLQSILQNQVERHGRHFFKEGSMVIPGQISYTNSYYAVKLQSTFNSAAIAGYLSSFVGSIVTGATSSAAFTPNDTDTAVNGVSFTNGYAAPELSRDTGEIIYVENRRAISRASDQTEDIKVVVEF